MYEVKSYSINLLKIFMSLLLVSRFVQSSDDNYIHVKPYEMFIKFYAELVVV